MSGKYGSVQDLFDYMADALREGRCEDFASVFKVPTILLVGTGRVYTETQSEVADFMRQYRSNMLVEGYARSTATIVANEAAPDGQRRALVHWQHFNTKGAKFRDVYASYFMKRDADGAWMHTEVELIDEMPQRLAAGLLIERARPRSSSA